MNPRWRLRRVSRPPTQIDEVLTVFHRRRKRGARRTMAPPLFIPQERDDDTYAHAHQYSFSCSVVYCIHKKLRDKKFSRNASRYMAFGVERSRAWLDEYVRALFAELARCATEFRKKLLRYRKIREIGEFLGNCIRHVTAFVGPFITGTIAKKFIEARLWKSFFCRICCLSFFKESIIWPQVMYMIYRNVLQS